MTERGERDDSRTRVVPGDVGAETQGDPAFLRPENEDDDGYDPYSDRRPKPDPLFEADPWE